VGIVAGIFVFFLTSLPVKAKPKAQGFSDCRVFKVQNYFDGRDLQTEGPYWIQARRGKIIRISGKRPLPTKGCEQIPLEQGTLIPGMIDVHTHLFLEDETYGADFSKALVDLMKKGREFRWRRGQVHALSMLRHGFTSVRDLGNSDQFLDERLKNLEKKGEGTFPRMFISGPALTVGVGQFPEGTSLKLASQEYTLLKNPDEIAKELKKLKNHHVDWVKVYADNDPNPQAFSLEVLTKVISAARDQGFKVAVHATSKESAERTLQSDPQSLEHGYDLNEKTLQKMAAKGVFLIPTDFDRRVCEIIHAKNPDPYYACDSYASRRRQRLLAAVKAGVPLAFGSDAYLDLSKEGLERGDLALESLMALKEHGLSTLQALRAATSAAADLLGQKNLGRIQGGAWADLVGVDGNPLNHIEDLRKIRFVFKGGKEMCGFHISCGGTK
jgi:imidazolonepropionase-like amidohydrolase